MKIKLSKRIKDLLFWKKHSILYTITMLLIIFISKESDILFYIYCTIGYVVGILVSNMKIK